MIQKINTCYRYFYDLIHIFKSQQINKVKINLMGGRLSSKTVSVFRFSAEISQWFWENNYKATISVIRYEVKGAKESFNEFIHILDDIYPYINCKINATERIIQIGNTTIRFIGMLSNRKKSVKKIGLARLGTNKDCDIRIYEEISEFQDERDIKIINQALGGAKFIIEFWLSNPWILSHFNTRQFVLNLPPNETALKTVGEQFKKLTDIEKKMITIWHLTNHRINDFLSDAQHQELTELWSYSRPLALIADYGMPGQAEGLIYASDMHNIVMPNPHMPIMGYFAGLDWGVGRNDTSSCTALILGRHGWDHKYLIVDDEYFHSNGKMAYKSDEHMASDAIAKVIDYMKRNLTKEMKIYGIRLAYDHSALALGGLLRQCLDKRPEIELANLITIMPCVKYSSTMRIDIKKQLMSQGRFMINKERCPNLWRSLETAMYDSERMVDGKPGRMAVDNDSEDALDYGIGEKMVNYSTAQITKWYK